MSLGVSIKASGVVTLILPPLRFLYKHFEIITIYAVLNS